MSHPKKRLRRRPYDARPGYLISSIRTVCKHRKCSFLTGLITSLTDLLQANHQGRISTLKTKSTASPVPAPIASLSEFFCFALAENFFFRPRREPVRRLWRESEPALISAIFFLFPPRKPQKRIKSINFHRKYELWQLRFLGKIVSLFHNNM